MAHICKPAIDVTSEFHVLLMGFLLHAIGKTHNNDLIPSPKNACSVPTALACLTFCWSISDCGKQWLSAPQHQHVHWHGGYLLVAMGAVCAVLTHSVIETPSMTRPFGTMSLAIEYLTPSHCALHGVGWGGGRGAAYEKQFAEVHCTHGSSIGRHILETQYNHHLRACRRGSHLGCRDEAGPSDKPMPARSLSVMSLGAKP